MSTKTRPPTLRALHQNTKPIASTGWKLDQFGKMPDKCGPNTDTSEENESFSITEMVVYLGLVTSVAALIALSIWSCMTHLCGNEESTVPLRYLLEPLLRRML